MRKKNLYKNAKAKRDGGAFFTVPAAVLNGAAYIGLNAHARMLLFDLLAQYNGSNNGDLGVAFSLMKPRGWRSEHTLLDAKRDLLEAGLIVETRKGARPNKASLYAVTWHALDECDGKLDISTQSFPRGAYKSKDRPKVVIDAVSAAIENTSLTAPSASRPL